MSVTPDTPPCIGNVHDASVHLLPCSPIGVLSRRPLPHLLIMAALAPPPAVFYKLTQVKHIPRGGSHYAFTHQHTQAACGCSQSAIQLVHFPGMLPATPPSTGNAHAALVIFYRHTRLKPLKRGGPATPPSINIPAALSALSYRHPQVSSIFGRAFITPPHISNAHAASSRLFKRRTSWVRLPGRPFWRLLPSTRPSRLRLSPTDKPGWCIPRGKPLPHLSTLAMLTRRLYISSDVPQLMCLLGALATSPSIGTSRPPPAAFHRRTYVGHLSLGPLPRLPFTSAVTPPPVVSYRRILTLNIPEKRPLPHITTWHHPQRLRTCYPTPPRMSIS